MIPRLTQLSSGLKAGIAALCICAPFPLSVLAQTDIPAQAAAPVAAAGLSVGLSAELPDAPLPQQTPPVPATPEVKPDQGPAPAAPGTSSSTDQAPQPVPPSQAAPASADTQQKTKEEIAEEQLKQEKKQRIGVLPNFNASYISDAVPLTARQKFRLMFYTEKDPATIGFSMFVALIGQAEGTHAGYGGGIGGYSKRFGQNYADTFDGAFWGNAVLPSLWHQDPRYFRLGKGSAKHRILYALESNVRAKHDGTGKWEPNYSNLVGNVISGGISNLYLPANERGVGSTFEGAATVTAEGGIGSMLEEFYPDFTQYLQRRRQRKQAAAMDKEVKDQEAKDKEAKDNGAKP